MIEGLNLLQKDKRLFKESTVERMIQIHENLRMCLVH
jgi:hypothetical protein